MHLRIRNITILALLFLFCSSTFTPVKRVRYSERGWNYLIHSPQERINRLLDEWTGYFTVFNPNYSPESRMMPGWRDFSRKMESYYSPSQIKIFVTLIHPLLIKEMDQALAADNSEDQINLDYWKEYDEVKFLRIDVRLESLIGRPDINPENWKVCLKDGRKNYFESDSVCIHDMGMSRIELFIAAGRENRAVSIYHNLYKSKFSIFIRKSDILFNYPDFQSFKKFDIVFFYKDEELGSLKWEMI